ncbi:3-oxo-tetronate kinase [Roseomonas sp. GCM10028921]
MGDWPAMGRGAPAPHPPLLREVPPVPLLGCIADDFTGATDLANTLAKGGMRTVLLIGTPGRPPGGAPGGELPEADAVVVSLATRAAPAREAVAGSLAACEALLAAGCRQILLADSSAFDPVAESHVGPVADALVRRLDAGFALVCPASPEAGRTVYQGHLFVGASLLGEGGMGAGPRAPGREPNFLRLLGTQVDGAVGLVPVTVVEKGAAAIRRAMTGLKESGRRYAVVDAFTDAHLLAIGEAAAGQALVIGGPGIALGLPANFRAAGLVPARDDAAALPAARGHATARGHAAVLAGSLSRSTLGQIGFARDRMHTLELDALDVPDSEALTRTALDWAEGLLGEGPVLIAGSAMPDRVAELRRRLGPERAGALVQAALAGIAAGLVERGVGRMVVAGSETSAAVVSRLGIRQLRIGAEIDPGIPWTSAGPEGPHLALKSGANGARDLFLKAFET